MLSQNIPFYLFLAQLKLGYNQEPQIKLFQKFIAAINMKGYWDFIKVWASP
jgi:hypothetical protein